MRAACFVAAALSLCGCSIAGLPPIVRPGDGTGSRTCDATAPRLDTLGGAVGGLAAVGAGTAATRECRSHPGSGACRRYETARNAASAAAVLLFASGAYGGYHVMACEGWPRTAFGAARPGVPDGASAALDRALRDAGERARR